MRFFIRKRRQTPAVIIVALIDVLIVLVIFLTITTTFKQIPALGITLPKSSQARQTGANDDAILVVSIDAKGIYYLGPDKTPLTPVQLETELASRAAQRPDLKLTINGDEGAPWGRIMKAMDLVKAAGIQSVSVMAEPNAPASNR